MMIKKYFVSACAHTFRYLECLPTHKTEVVVIEAKEERLKVSTQLQSATLRTTDKAWNICIVMEPDLNFKINNKTITNQPAIILQIYHG